MATRRASKLAAAIRFFCAGHRRPSSNDLGLAAVAAASLWAGTTQAQEAVAQSDAEEITVTGSRLRRDGMSTPTPVTALDIGEMRQMAPTLLMDSLDQLPQFRDNALSQTGSIFMSGGGSNAVNLRGIGSNRTLTLLDGRRLVPGQTGRHHRRRDPADGVDPTRRGRDGRRFGRVRLGRHQRRHELHSRHRVRGRQRQPANRHDGSARPPALSSRVRGGIARSARTATSSARSTSTTPTACWATKAATGAPKAGRCSRNRRNGTTAALLRAGRPLARDHVGRADPRRTAVAAPLGVHAVHRR